MKRTILTLLGAATALAVLAAPAQAGFGLTEFDVTYTEADGSSATKAGAHPYEMTTTLDFESFPTGEGGEEVEEPVKDVFTAQIPGLIGNTTAVPTCALLDFVDERCPNSTAVGLVANTIAGRVGIATAYSAVYNVAPPPGVPVKLGFHVAGGFPVPLEFGLSESPPHRVIGGLTGTPQVLAVLDTELTLWASPGDSRHDSLRGDCLVATGESQGICPTDASPDAFLTVPRSCQGPLATSYAADSWHHPGAWLDSGEPDLSDPAWVSGEVLTHGESGEPRGFSACADLTFAPEIEAKPTSRAAQSPTGLDFSLRHDNPGLLNPNEGARSAADIAKAVVTLPRGMSANPSLAEGLETCSEAEVGRETSDSAPGEGCPEAAKIGRVEVETPLLDETLGGSLYIAEPYRNPFGSLIALYVVIKNENLGVKILQPLEVQPDLETGQLVTTAEEIPELPFSDFRLHFREGGRSPLISPPGCGTHEVKAMLYPSSGRPPVESTSEFEVISGPNEGPCPPSTATFSPGFEAGTLNNAAGRYSPFYMRLTRKDAEQDLARFSAVLPPGVVGKIAGIPWCPEASIAAAKARTGPNGAQEELDSPSCPAASAVGRTVAGAGVGSQLTYVPGSLYLAGPYNGAPLSIVSITPAKAGPFDAGVVVVREALTLNPVTGVVEVDGAASDPIPHILRGIPLNVRDLRVYTDRPEFTLNSTSCAEQNTWATLWGAGTTLDPSAETPVALAARYQAADCAALDFDPQLKIMLKGGVKRGAHPALKAVVTPRPGHANFARAAVTLPRSAFLDQAHIRTICTRVQFAAGPGHGALCPPAAQYGYARAWSPLLDAPAEGPVYLRSSDNKLPDLVVALKGPASAPVDVELSSRIDSVRGGIRSTFTGIPDLPVSRFVLNMQGGKKGLIVNSRHLCFKPKRNRAKANIAGQNGRVSKTNPRVVALTCAKRRKAKRARAKRSAGRVARASIAG